MKKIVIGESPIHGKGIFAGEDIGKEERILYLNGERVHKVIKNRRESVRTANWIGTGKYSWYKTNGTPFRYLNHSCNPNSAITGTKTLVALEPIKKDEEITVDYSMTDADPYYHIKCRCGETNCRKEIRAIYFVPKEVFMRHMPYVPRYFQRAFIRNYLKLNGGVKKES